MNKSEKKAYEWLKKKGYKKLVFYGNRTPDFDADEECFEIKRGYKLKTGEIKIVFGAGQREKIKDKGGKVLVFMDDDKPLDILKPDEIMENRVRNIILHDAGGNKIHFCFTIDRELFKKIEEERDGLSRSAFVEMGMRRYMKMDYPLRE